MSVAGISNNGSHDPMIWRIELQSNASKLFIPYGGAMELAIVPRDKHGKALSRTERALKFDWLTESAGQIQEATINKASELCLCIKVYSCTR